MGIPILIPTPLRRYVGGAKRVEVNATTVESAMAALAEQSPELRRQLFDDAGKLRNFVNLFVGDVHVRELAPAGQPVQLKDGDVITIVPAIAGGAPREDLSKDEIARYSRHLIMPEVTLEGQKRLKKARVLCIGAGGLGSPLSLYLAAAGVGKLGIVDFDVVDLSNIQRQILYSTADVGRPKLEAARERLTQLNPEIEVVAHPMRLSSWNAMELFAEYDVVADGSDNFPTRYLVNDACVLSGKPNIYASIFRFEGQVSVFNAPGGGPCYRCLFPEPPPPGLVTSCAEGGVLGVLPGIIGSMQALEVLKVILGKGDVLSGRLILFDALAFKFRELPFNRNPACAVCGTNPTVTAPVDYENFCGMRGEEVEVDARGIPTMSVEELHARRKAGETFNLLDVREAHEFAIARIPGSTLLPLGDVPARLHELDTASTYILHCHRGPRALEAYRIMKRAGFGRLQVLAGGVDAWAEKIDSTQPRY